MNGEKFSSLEELYRGLLPALKTKVSEMKQEKMNVSVEEVWRYFCKNVWPNKKDLTLGEMVNDILNTDSFILFRDRK